MAYDGDDDRPKKSWREIDQMREKSSHRKDGGGARGPSEERLSRSQAYRSYKSQLNKLFDGGALPEALKAKLEEGGVASDAKRRKELAQKLIAATSPKEVRAALAAHREAFGFPVDEEALAKLLDLDDEAIALETLAAIEGLLSEGTLKRAASLKARIKTAQMTIDSPKVQQAARDLLAKL